MMAGNVDGADAPEAVDDVRALFAEELRKLHRQSGRSLRELEQLAFTSDSALSRYMAGQTVPPWTVVEALCEHGGGNADELRVLWQHARRSRSARRAVRKAEPAADSGASPAPEEQDQSGAVPPADVRRLLSALRPRQRWVLTTIVALGVSIVAALSAAAAVAGMKERAPGREAPPAATGTATVVCAMGYRLASDGRCRPRADATIDPMGGKVHEVYYDSSGWRTENTGLRALAASAVDMGTAHPHLMLISGGVLVHAFRNGEGGWQTEGTGIRAVAVAAVNAGGARPRCMTVDDRGHLHEIRGDAGAWRDTDTGITVKTVSAVYVKGAHPNVVATDPGGRVLNIYADGSGWHAEDTRVRAESVSAVYMRGSWPQIMVADASHHLLQIYADDTGWHAGDTTQVATDISAVNMGGFWPDLIAVNPDGDVVHIYGNGSGWHTDKTGFRAVSVSAVNLNWSKPYAVAIE